MYRQQPIGAGTRRLVMTPPQGLPRRTASHDVVFYVPWIGPLLTSRSDTPPPGGAETQIYLLASALAARGYRVALVAFAIPGGLPREVNGVRVIARPKRRGQIRGVGKVVETITLFFSLRRVNATTFVQRAASSDTGLVALVAKFKRSRFVYSSANVVDFDFGQLERRPTNLALYHLGVRAANSVVVQTDEQASLCVKRFGRTARVIRSIAEPASERRAAGQYFIWIGRYAPYKHPDAFLDLASRLPNIEFRVVGVPDRPGAHLANQIARRAGELDNVVVEPFRPRRELMDLIESAVAVVNTSDYEGMPNIFLEGWARGVPALAFKHDPDGVIVREGVGRFAGGDFERFVSQTVELWDLRERQHDLTLRCRAYVAQNHAQDKVVEDWITALRLAAPSVRMGP